MLKRFFSFFTIPFNQNRIYTCDDNNKVILQIDPEKNNQNDDIVYIISSSDKDQCGICYKPLDQKSIKINCNHFHKNCLENSCQIHSCKHCNNTITFAPKK
jgi:hypothetical protein